MSDADDPNRRPPVLGYRPASSAAGAAPARRRRSDRTRLRVANAILAGVGLAILAPCVGFAAACVVWGLWSGRTQDDWQGVVCFVIPGGFGLVLLRAGVAGFRRAGEMRDGPA